jgi:hypothetical protein
MLPPLVFQSLDSASIKKEEMRLLRTITADCVEEPLADLIAQTWATTWAVISLEEPQFHVLALTVIGLVLP